MNIALLDDDATLLRILSRRLINAGHQVHTFAELPPLQALVDLQLDACVLDLRYGNDSGLQSIQTLKQAMPNMRLVILTGFASIATAVQAVKLGADDYLTKPVDFQLLLSALSAANRLPTCMQPADMPVLSADQVEWEHIQRVLTEQQGNISQTARALGMHRRTLQRRLAKRRPD